MVKRICESSALKTIAASNSNSGQMKMLDATIVCQYFFAVEVAMNQWK